MKTQIKNQYSLNLAGKKLIILAYTKNDIRKRFKLSRNDLNKYCARLYYNPERKTDVDITIKRKGDEKIWQI
jgi:hypothetical protein